MDFQFIGQVDTPAGKQGAMLCIDSDRPSEFMVQWWNEAANTAAGCLFDAAPTATGLKLTPNTLFRTVNGGGLFAPPSNSFTEEEKSWIAAIQADLHKVGNGYEGTWSGPESTHGTIILNPVAPCKPIDPHQCATWSAFKDWASEIRKKRNGEWFRGHGSNEFPLTTTLHRLGRFRLERYVAIDLPKFSAQAEATLNRRFDLGDGKDYSTILGLGRHHGLPTPLIDWTASPYIAAFFAFSDALENRDIRDKNSKVRIYALSAEFVRSVSPPTIIVSWARPYVNTLTVGPLHNPRLSAQQGGFLVTNVGDLEAYMRGIEARMGVQVLYTADIPASLAPEALSDLAFMGLTAATMFPGLDGVGRMTKLDMLLNQPTAT
jgi:FRG domain-containing protein